MSGLPKPPPPPDPHSPLTTGSSNFLNSKWALSFCQNCQKHTDVRLSDSNCKDCAKIIDDLMKPSNLPAVPAHSHAQLFESKPDSYPHAMSTGSSSQPGRSDTRVVSTSSGTSHSQTRTSPSNSISITPTDLRERSSSASGSGAAAERDREALKQRREQQLMQHQPDVVPRVADEPLPPIEFVSVPALHKWPSPEEFDRNRLLESSPTTCQLFETYKKLVCLRGRSQQQPATEHAELDTHRSSCATGDYALEQRAREMVVCPDLIQTPLPLRLLSPQLARAFFASLLSWLAEVDALAVAFSPVCRDQCHWHRFEERFPHALRLPSLVRFEHLLRRLELHLCLLIRRGPFVPEMALIDVLFTYTIHILFILLLASIFYVSSFRNTFRLDN